MTERRRLYRKGQAITDWDSYSIEQLYSSVEHGVDSRNWDQVHAWRTMADLCNHHASALTTAAEALLERWSATGPGAARQFIERVGKLVDRLRYAGTAAAVNAKAVENILLAELSARSELTQLRLDREGRTGRQLSAIAIKEIDERAADIMRHADAALADARASLRPLYASWTEAWDGKQYDEGIGDALPPATLVSESPQPQVFGATQRFYGADGIPAAATSHQSSGAILDGLDSSVSAGLGIDRYVDRTRQPISGPSQTHASAYDSFNNVLPLPQQLAVSPTSNLTTVPKSVGALAPPIAPLTGTRPLPNDRKVEPAGVLGNSYLAHRRRKPNNDWAMPSGVPGVIDRTDDSWEHDPGPGTLGLPQ